EPKEVEFPVARPAEVVAPLVEPVVEQPEMEVIAPEPEKKVNEVKEEIAAPVEVIEAGPAYVESQAPAVDEKEEEVAPIPQIVEPESQPPMTPPIEKDLDLPIVSDVSPRIPTPPDEAPGNPLDWDRLVEEICKSHEGDVPVPKSEDLVAEIPGFIAVGGSEVPKEETLTILPVPKSTLP